MGLPLREHSPRHSLREPSIPSEALPSTPSEPS